MPADTRNKRAALIEYGMPFGLAPAPDGTINSADRRQLVGLYAFVTGEPTDPDLCDALEVYLAAPDLEIVLDDKLISVECP